MTLLTSYIQGITSVYCKGNVHVRNSAMAKFKQKGGPRVILLSLEHAASGSNLTEASHVILVDPIKGSAKFRTATEQQAIGRAHRIGQAEPVTVVRLIMKNTIEHTYWKNQQSM